MADVAPVPAAVPAPSPAKKASKPKKVGPRVSELIVKAVAASKQRGGVSAAGLRKALAAGGYNVDKNKSRIKTAIKSLVTKGILVRTKGTGAAGSFKVGKTADKKAKKPAKKAAPKKKPAAKKPAAAKKPKKTAVAKKSPKKAKKPAAAKSPKKVSKSPKKVVKKAPATKKAPAAKKAPAKKAAKPKVKKAAPKK